MTENTTAERKTLSCLIVARNEQAMLPDCLKSLGFADQIVVVLDRTTDNSKAIADQAGAKIIEGSWPSEGERRNTGIAACTSDWILEVDADERATESVAQEVTGLIQTSPDGLYLIPIRNMIGDREVRYGWGAYNGAASAPRLFSKGAKVWGPERVHPSLQTGARLGSLRHGLIHLVDKDLADMFDRMNRYTTLMAQDAVDKNTVPSLSSALRRILTRGWKSYIARKGYREGIYGVALAFFAAGYSLQIHLKAREILERRTRE